MFPQKASSDFRLFNTLTNRVEPLDLIEPGKLRMYACGPTVYSYAHIGNFRSFLTSDLIVRTAQAIGLKVNYVTNITDVGHLTDDDVADSQGEDRMARALRSKEGESFGNVWDLARHYANVLIADWDRLNLEEPTLRPRATEHIRQQILAVQSLISAGHAYETTQGVYFRVASFPDYGKLSGNRDAAELTELSRELVVDSAKEDPRDFALWKKDDKHLMQWFSPWGWGFPGWHIECSVMANEYLGEEIDLHAGGEDLIFPHHECEIAQAESLTGKQFARHWVHTRFLQVEGEKMSKSKGNFLTVQGLIESKEDGGKGVDPMALRLTLISGHYRKPYNFTMDTLRANTRHVQRLREIRDLLDNVSETAATDKTVEPLVLDDLSARMLDAMLDDLNTPEAIAAVLEGVKRVMAKRDTLGSDDVETAKDWLGHVESLLGIIGRPIAADPADDASLAAAVETLLSERAVARASRDWARADQIRDELGAMGVEVMDTAEGVTWRRKIDS